MTLTHLMVTPWAVLMCLLECWWNPPTPGTSQAAVTRDVLDGFGGILFADENLQEAELGFDPLVLPVLLQHRHPVLLLNISTTEEGV